MNNLLYVVRLLGSGFLFDIRSGRLRAILFLTVANIFPDLILFAYVRPLFWRLAGVDIPIFGGCAIRKNVWVDFPQNLKCGERININRGTIISAHGGVIIESDVTISFYVGIHSVYHKGAKHEIDVLKPVLIKSGSIIYSHAVVLPGSVLNDCSLISAGSIIKGETTANYIYSGNPAFKMNKRNDL